MALSDLTLDRRQPLTDDDIRAAAAQGLERGIGYDTDELVANWENAYGYYRAELPPATTAHDSAAVSADVSDTVEWLLPAILKPLVESPDVVRFDPVNPEDQDQADAESDYVHHTFMKKCDGFLKLYSHIKDALLLKNAVFFTYWDPTVETSRETYQNLTDIELGDLLTPADGSRVEIIRATTRREPLPDPLTGAPMRPAQPPQQPQPQLPGLPPPVTMAPPPPPTQALHDVTVRRYRTGGRIRVENCRPEAFAVLDTHNSLTLDDARWCAYRMRQTRGQLLAAGYSESLVEDLPVARSLTDDPVELARQDVEGEPGYRDLPRDPREEYVDIYRVYLLLDVDGDGFDEKLLVTLGGQDGQVLLGWDEVAECPFSASTPFIAPHKFWGYSIYDKLRHIADHKTKVLRMLEDNLDSLNNPKKKVVRGRANLDDLLASVVGGLWRVDSLDAIDIVPTVPIDQQARGLLDYYDKQRSERSGMDPNAQAITNVMPEESMNTAVERILSMKEELVGMMIRVFAETGVKSMFLKIRNLMLRHMPREELVQLRNKWSVMNPGNWIERTNTTIKVGLGTGDRNRKQAALLQILAIQKDLMAGGLMGPLVSPERIGYTLAELVRVSGLGDPDDFLLDPAMFEREDPNYPSPRGREALRAHALRQQQMQAQQQADQMAQQATLQAQIELVKTQEAIRAQAKLQQAQLDAQTAAADRMAKLEIETEKLRVAWAELAATQEAERAKLAANFATTVIQQGMSEDNARAEHDRTMEQAAAQRGHEAQQAAAQREHEVQQARQAKKPKQ